MKKERKKYICSCKRFGDSIKELKSSIHGLKFKRCMELWTHLVIYFLNSLVFTILRYHGFYTIFATWLHIQTTINLKCVKCYDFKVNIILAKIDVQWTLEGMIHRIQPNDFNYNKKLISFLMASHFSMSF